MPITRRRFIAGGATVAAATLLPLPRSLAASPPALSKFTESLPDLADLGVIDATSGGTRSIDVVNALHRFHASLPPARTLAYRPPGGQQTYLGPVIVARRNVSLDLVTRNMITSHPVDFAIDQGLVDDMIEDGVLPPGTDDAVATRMAVHLHGGNTEAASDGGPLDTCLPGQSLTNHYHNDQESAGLWYHDHALAITRLNVYAGLAGGYLIRDDEDPGDGSNLPAYPFEVPLIIQDRMFDANGALAYPPNEDLDRPWAPEFFGDVAIVNGKVWPHHEVRRGVYRFRVYNGCNSRFLRLSLDTGRGLLPFWQIGTDGGLLDTSVALTRLLLGPGERADLLVDFGEVNPGQRVLLMNNAPSPFPNGPRSAAQGVDPLRKIMAFDVLESGGDGHQVPTGLRESPITRLAGLPVANRRTMTLVEVLDPDGIPLTAVLNNREFASHAYAEHPVQADTLEQWEIVNLTGDAHPIHLHFTQFQVQDRQRFDADRYLEDVYGGTPAPGFGPYPPPSPDDYLTGPRKLPPQNERGWKDTAIALPGEVTRLLVPFGPNAAGGLPLAIGRSFLGTYVWHCHILEHEDNDMMQRYTIVG